MLSIIDIRESVEPMTSAVRIFANKQAALCVSPNVSPLHGSSVSIDAADTRDRAVCVTLAAPVQKSPYFAGVVRGETSGIPPRRRPVNRAYQS